MVDAEEYKKKLLALRAEYTQRIDAIHKDTHHVDEPVSKDFAEQVVDRENDDVLDALDDEAKQHVMEIDKALLRIEADEYGICTSCGEEIPEGRLEIVPYAEFCVHCAEDHGQ
jgi:RNA polymerase-binding protein DksA